MSRQKSAITRNAFAFMLAAMIRHAGENGQLRYDPQEYALVCNGKGLRLGHAYREFTSASPEEHIHVFKRWTDTWFASQAPAADFAEARHQLFPAVDRRGVHACAELSEQTRRTSRSPVPHQIVGEHYAIQLVYGQANQKVELPAATLSEWGVTFEEAMDVARENLANITHGRLREISSGLWTSAWQDNCDDVRFIFSDLVRQHDVLGDHVAMMPDEDTLIVTGSRDIDGLREMASMAAAVCGEPRFTSAIPLRLDGETWVPFVLPPDHPLYAQFRSLWSNSLAMDYGRQEELLQRLYETRGEDILVTPTYSCDDPTVGTLCVWDKDKDQLLPETRFVAFGGISGDPGLYYGHADWLSVREVVGNLMEPQGIYPERYRVRELPTVEQLQALHLTSPVRLADTDLHAVHPHITPSIQRRPK